MDLSDESSRGSSKSSVRSNKSKNGNQSKSKTTVTPEQIEQFCAVTGIVSFIICIFIDTPALFL